MQLHELKTTHKNKKRKRIGRGGKRGTYSGRGIKGQKARAGARIRPAWRDLIKQMPKKRGAYFKPQRVKPSIINLEKINIFFKKDEVVCPEALLEKGLIVKIKGKNPAIKILGKGKITKKLIIRGCQASKGAKAKVEKAGGTVKN